MHLPTDDISRAHDPALVFSDQPAEVREPVGLPFGLWSLGGLFPYRSCPAACLLSLRPPACHQWSDRVFHICCHEQRGGRQVGNLKDAPLIMAFSQNEVTSFFSF